MIAVAVASEALLARMDANSADLAKLADPRTIGMNDAVADEIARRAVSLGSSGVLREAFSAIWRPR